VCPTNQCWPNPERVPGALEEMRRLLGFCFSLELLRSSGTTVSCDGKDFWWVNVVGDTKYLHAWGTDGCVDATGQLLDIECDKHLILQKCVS